MNNFIAIDYLKLTEYLWLDAVCDFDERRLKGPYIPDDIDEQIMRKTNDV